MQPRVRYNQASAVLPEDSLVGWSRKVAVQSAEIALASPDYRTLSLRPQSRSADSVIGPVALPELSLDDIPGAYAYEDEAEGERLVTRQMEALDALREQVEGRGSVRSSAPGTTFTLVDHASDRGTANHPPVR